MLCLIYIILLPQFEQHLSSSFFKFEIIPLFMFNFLLLFEVFFFIKFEEIVKNGDNNLSCFLLFGVFPVVNFKSFL